MNIPKKSLALLAISFMLISSFAGCGSPKQDPSQTSGNSTNGTNLQSQGDSTTYTDADPTGTGAGSDTQAASDTTKGAVTTKGSEKTGSSTTKGSSGGGWVPNTQKNLTPEQLDVKFPLRKNVKGTVKAFSPFSNDELFIKAKKEFEKAYPGTKVEMIGASNVTRNEKLMSLIKSGDSPDYVYTIYTDYPLRAYYNLTQPIDQYIQPHPAYSDFLMNNFTTYKGKKYAAIIETPPMMLYYNTALFQRKGEKTPDYYYKSGSWTWSTLRTLAKRMTDSQNGVYGFSTDFDYYFPLCAGQDVIKFVNGKPYMNLQNNQKYMKAHQFFIDMINKDKSAYPTHWNAHTEFGKGKVAMCFMGVAHEMYINNNGGIKTYDVVPFPKMDASSPYYSMVGGLCGGFSIGSGAKNIQGGMAFGEMVMNTALAEGNMTKYKKIYTMGRECDMHYVGSAFDGYGLTEPYFQGFCGWARTGTKDLNTLINENVQIMDNKLKEYRK